MIFIKAVHFMKLNPKMFQFIKDGRKTVELRLYDEKRQVVKSGDTIIFRNIADLNETVEVVVQNINWYDSFKTLYSHTDKLSMGYEAHELADYTDMEKYYTPGIQYEYGVVAIEIALCSDITSYENLNYKKSIIPADV